MEGIWKLFNWIVRLAYINLLWILFSLLGFILLGIGPATVSVFNIMKRLLADEKGVSIWNSFVKTYKKEFFRANRLMLIIFPVCFLIYLDFKFLQMLPSSYFTDKIVFTAMIILSLLVIVWIAYLFAVYVYFDLKFSSNFKYALMIAGINPLPTILMLLGLFIFMIILFIVPAISIFYLVSAPIFIVQLCSRKAFQKVSSLRIS